MEKKPRVKVEISHENYEVFIKNFSFYATVVAPALLFWLDILEGERNLPNLKMSDHYRITSLSADRESRSGEFDVTYYNRTLDEQIDYKVIFDFSRQSDFQPKQVRQVVQRALTQNSGDEARTS